MCCTTWNTFKIFSVIWPVTLELKKTPCENQRTPSFMSVWVIPLERMTFQKYSWCSNILQFDIRLIFREQSYSLHHKNKHWNFILLIFHQRGKLWVNYTNMRKKKKKTKAKVLNDNLIITSANKTVNFLMSQIYYEMLWNIQVPLS